MATVRGMLRVFQMAPSHRVQNNTENTREGHHIQLQGRKVEFDFHIQIDKEGL